MEDYIQCELIGGGSPRHLKTLYDLLIVAVHYTHINDTHINTHISINYTSLHISKHAMYCCYC